MSDPVFITASALFAMGLVMTGVGAYRLGDEGMDHLFSDSEWWLNPIIWVAAGLFLSAGVFSSQPLCLPPTAPAHLPECPEQQRLMAVLDTTPTSVGNYTYFWV